MAVKMMSNIQIKIVIFCFFFISAQNIGLLVLVKTVSVCHLFWVTSGGLFEFKDVVS